MLWRAKSLKGEIVTRFAPVKTDCPVVCCGMWQLAQPMLMNWFLPWVDVVVAGAGVGAAESRIKPAKLTMSDEKSDAGLADGSGSVKCVASSGVGLKRQPCVSSRSLGNASLVTPCSTL